MSNITNAQWAEAVALRISDEWNGNDDFPEDAKLLKRILTKLFKENPGECKKLIGTGIIEEDYFDFQGVSFTEKTDRLNSGNKNNLIKEIIDYCYDDERRHWEELGKPINHIFTKIKELKAIL